MLRGLGVSMALPWMESLRVWGDTNRKSQQASDAPTRMAILFTGCGFHKHEWWAKGEGTNMELEKSFIHLMILRRKWFSFAAFTMLKH